MTDNDEMINQKQLHLNDMKQQLDEINQEFIQKTAIFLKESYLNYAKIQFSKEYDIAYSLGDVKAKELKSKVEELSNDAPRVAKTYLSDSSLGNFDGIYQAVNSAFELLADILRKYGFSKFNQEYKYPNSDCPFDIPWSDDMNKINELYNQKYAEFLNIAEEIESIKINQASSFWDSL
jgi:hypothetical protein